MRIYWYHADVWTDEHSIGLVVQVQFHVSSDDDILMYSS